MDSGVQLPLNLRSKHRETDSLPSSQSISPSRFGTVESLVASSPQTLEIKRYLNWMVSSCEFQNCRGWEQTQHWVVNLKRNMAVGCCGVSR